MKLIIFLFTLLSFVNSADILVSNKNIKYHEILDFDNLSVQITNKKIRCDMFNKNNLLNRSYQAKHYIIKGQAICKKDVQVFKRDKIRYDFGNIVIERDGKIIGENKKYIKIKSSNGKIQKIYKNGQIK